MLDEEFKKQRARTVRELADKAADPFIKKRLQDLAARYEDDDLKSPTQLTPIHGEFTSRGTGPRGVRSIADGTPPAYTAGAKGAESGCRGHNFSDGDRRYRANG
jgi:hypothetical protein